MNSCIRHWSPFFFFLIVLLPFHQVNSSMAISDWDWSVLPNDTNSWKFIRLRDTQLELTQMTWNTNMIVKEDTVISAKIISISSPTSLAISLSSSDGQSINQIIDIRDFLISNMSTGLGRVTFYLPTSPRFWENLATNLSLLSLNYLVIENGEKTFSLKVQEYSPLVTEWSFDKNSGILRYFLSEFDSHELIHLKRTDIISQENSISYFERSVLFLGILSIFTLIILISWRKRKKDQFF